MLVPGSGRFLPANSAYSLHLSLKYLLVKGLSPELLLRTSLDSLSPTDQDSFFSLSSAAVPNVAPDRWDDQTLMGIFQTNAIAAGENAAIFAKTARINHACGASFNAVYSWRAAEGVLVVHALRPIRIGQVCVVLFGCHLCNAMSLQEILTTYTDTKRPRQERQSVVRASHN